MFSIDKLIGHLKNLSVTEIYFCAGARNSYLHTDLKQHFQLHYELDERAASFMALGQAKVSKHPVVVCTTSGTAVSECYSAVIEAHYAKVPLIILSADRPGRLRHTGAPQTIDQLNLFGKYASFFNVESERAIFSKEINYPYHINIEVDDGEIFSETVNIKETYNFPLIILAENANLSNEDLDTIIRNDYAVYVECLSDFKNSKINQRITNEYDLIHYVSEGAFDCVIKYGHTPFTKLWRLLDTTLSHLPVYSHRSYSYTGLKSAFEFSLLSEISIEQTYKLDLSFKDIKSIAENYSSAEIHNYFEIKSKVQPSDIVFVGNSMPIRYWQLVDDLENKIFASRGVNGIDGQIATAIGIARSTNSHVHCIIGDQTFMYDFSVLQKDLPKNLSIHLINNGGGRIFDVVKATKEIVFSHDQKFKDKYSFLNNQVIEYFSNPVDSLAFLEELKR